jgi:ribosomal protein S14
MPDGGSPSIPRGARQDFKNFHRLLCERFGYVHDEKDWERDQLSLIEHIAKRGAVETTSRPTPEQLGERWADTLKALANGESPEKASEPLRRCVGCGATSGFTSPLNLCQTCEAAMQKGNQ